MQTIRHLNDSEQEFVSVFEKLCYTRNQWTAWCDFVTVFAYSISNAVDKANFEKRESAYMSIISKYKKSETESIARLVGITVAALEANPDQDFLGSLYMRLELSNKHNGQFFTPYNVAKMCGFLAGGDPAGEIEEKGWISVNDCCCGGGAMLIGFVNYCIQNNIDFQDHVLFVGQDIDYVVAMMCYIQLSLLGCAGYIIVGDTIRNPPTGDTLFLPQQIENVFVMPMYCSWVWDGRRCFKMLDMRCYESKESALPADSNESAIIINPVMATKKAAVSNAMSGQLSLFEDML